MKITQLIEQILLEEKKKRDRCLRIADRKFDKPSAYKSGAVVRCRAGKIWKDIKEEDAYDKDDEKPAKPKKEDLDAKELQTKKTDNYKSKNESWKQAWEAATHKMPDGTMMKGAKHKDEALDSKDNKTVKDVVSQLKGATKAHSAQAKDLEKAMKNEADDVDNGDEKKDTKKKLHADSGSKLTKVETEPSVDYKN